MPKVIISGRGGSGKSTLVTLLARLLQEKGEDTLVVDVDESNLGLGKMLGIDPPAKTLMDYLGGKPAVRERLMASLRQGKGEGVRLFEETLTFDTLSGECVNWNGCLGFLRIGKIEHSMEGCACPMGAISRAFLKQLEVGEKQWVLVDTEAGIEHFGRGVFEGADVVVMVVDPSHDAVLLAEKARMLAEEAGKRCLVVLNKVDETTEPLLRQELRQRGIDVAGVVNFSISVTQSNLLGKPLQADSLKGSIERLLEELKSA